MSPPKKGKRYICSIHDEIEEIASSLEEMLGSFLSKEPLEMLKKIQLLTQEAKEAGQSMEDRLKEYKHTIESIGFQRKKGK
jgi:ElaB/YqjD/DUF883 family membrane-anchored ribosome-binding protein